MRLPIFRPWCRLAPLLLAACGGGGGDGSANGERYAVSQVWATMLTQPSTWTTSGVGSDGRTWRLSSTFAPGSDAAFPVSGDTAQRTTQLTSVTVDGASQGSAAITLYFSGSPPTLLGDQDDTGQCGAAISSSLPPDEAQLGQSGPLATVRDLIDCPQTRAWNGLRQHDWSLETEGAIVFFCFKTSLMAASGSPLLGVSNECYETTTTGALGPRARVSLSIVQPAFELVARNY
jgi:hypothetical protein